MEQTHAQVTHDIKQKHKGGEHTNFSALLHYADAEVLVSLLALLHNI